MDLLNIVINPLKAKDICCMCYKNCKNMSSLHQEIEVHDENFNLISTLRSIMNNLFPLHDIILTQICEDCSNIVLKMFTLMQRSYMKSEILKCIIENLHDNIEEFNCKLIFKNIPKKCKLKINIPNDDGILDYKPNKSSVQCDKCLMTFYSKFLLTTHIQMTHKNDNNSIICDICGKLFTKSTLLKAHLGSHMKKECPYCFKCFKSQSYFNVHIKNHKKSSLLLGLDLIKMKKKSLKYYNCKYCTYKSPAKPTLQAHINKEHLKIKPFSCETCGKSFNKKDNLTQHLMTHNKEKDKTCHICGDTFLQEKTLQEHLKLHTGQKPYKCKICNVGFITSGRRLEHIKRKHMEKTESCVVCGKKFSLKKDLNAHMKKVHSSPCCADMEVQT